MKILELIKFADLFTIINVFFGFLSITFSINRAYLLSGLLMLASVLFDYLDGRIARMLKQQNQFGKNLDSLSDIISFGVAPAIFYYSMSSRSTFVVVSLLFFVACGMLRLARFNIMARKEFIGVPITLNGILFPVLYFVALKIPLTLDFWPFIFIIMGVLMVSAIRVRKVL